MTLMLAVFMSPSNLIREFCSYTARNALRFNLSILNSVASSPCFQREHVFLVDPFFVHNGVYIKLPLLFSCYTFHPLILAYVF
jgi:hypothetical protein